MSQTIYFGAKSFNRKLISKKYKFFDTIFTENKYAEDSVPFMDTLIQLLKTNVNNDNVVRLAIVLGHETETFNKRFRKTNIFDTQKYIAAKNKHMYYVLPTNKIKKLNSGQVGFFSLFKKDYILEAINKFCIEKDYMFSINSIMEGDFLQIQPIEMIQYFPYDGMTYLLKFCLAFSLNLLDEDMDEENTKHELDEYYNLLELSKDSSFMKYYHNVFINYQSLKDNCDIKLM